MKYYMLTLTEAARAIGMQPRALNAVIHQIEVNHCRLDRYIFVHPMSVQIIHAYTREGKLDKDKLYLPVKESDPHYKRLLSATAEILAEFPQSNYGRLFARIVVQAVHDLFAVAGKDIHKAEVKGIREKAKEYLSGDISHAEVFGIESGWIRRILKQYYLW